MSLIIDQGPLPQDGERVDAAVFLENWVNNTDIRGLDASSFQTSIQFVASSTNAPVTARGRLWFKRGTGQLFVYDIFDRAASPRYPGAVNEYWMPLCPQRAFVVECDGQATQGGLMDFSSKGPGLSVLNSYYENAEVRRIPSYKMDHSAEVAGRLGLYQGVALESRATGLPCPLVEWGFCDAAFGCGGSNVLRGAFACLRVSNPSESWYLHPRSVGYTGNSGFREIGLVVTPTNSPLPHIARIYKKPTPSWDFMVG